MPTAPSEISQRLVRKQRGPSVTRFYILAQDGAGAATIAFDEANLFARAIGLDLSSNEAKRILVAKGDKVTLKSARDRYGRKHHLPTTSQPRPRWTRCTPP